MTPLVVVMAMDESFRQADPHNVNLNSHAHRSHREHCRPGNPLRNVFGIRQEMSRVHCMSALAVIVYAVTRLEFPSSNLALDMFVQHVAIHCRFVLKVFMPLYLSYTAAWRQGCAQGPSTTLLGRLLLNERAGDTVRPLMTQAVCLELLLFLQAEQQYRQVCATVPRPDQCAVNVVGQQIIDQFIVENAPLQVNISYRESRPFRQRTTRNASLAQSTVCSTDRLTEIHAGTFDEARKEVLRLLQVNVLPRISGWTRQWDICGMISSSAIDRRGPSYPNRVRFLMRSLSCPEHYHRRRATQRGFAEHRHV